MRRHRSANEELFGVILRHWRSLPSEQEKARARGRALTQALREWTPKK